SELLGTRGPCVPREFGDSRSVCTRVATANVGGNALDGRNWSASARRSNFPNRAAKKGSYPFLEKRGTTPFSPYQEYRNITCVVRMKPPCETMVPNAELPCTVFI